MLMAEHFEAFIECWPILVRSQRIKLVQRVFAHSRRQAAEPELRSPTPVVDYHALVFETLHSLGFVVAEPKNRNTAISP